MPRMSVGQSRLGWVARRFFGLSLAGLVVIAALANVAFYLSLFDNWTLIRPIGPAVVFGAAFVGFTFVLGFLVHAVRVLAYGHAPAEEVQPQQSEPARTPGNVS